MSATTDAAQVRKTVVRRFLTSAQSGDLSAMADCLTEDFRQVFPRPGVPGAPAGVQGRDAMASFLASLSIYSKGPRTVEIESILAEGPIAAVRYRMTAVTAAGQPYENSYCQILQFRGQRIALAWEYCDTFYGAKMLRPELIQAPAD